MRKELLDPLESVDPGAERIDHGVREFGHLKPRLRDDLEFTLQRFGSEVSYIVEDRVRSKFYRIGVSEYRFIALLDGTVNIENALASSAASLGKDAIDSHEAAIIVRWLIDNELAFTSASRDPEFLGSMRERRRRARSIGRLNLLFVKLPLVNPDRFLDYITPYLRWMLGGQFLVLWLAVVVSGVYQVSVNWSEFSSNTRDFLSIENWFWIALIWTALKIIHELFHGLTCKRYGGEVYEAGVILILFAPIGYVDATSSWRFASRWQRMHTAFAGMYIEFFIAGIAAWIWQASEPGIVNHLSWNVILIASITTFLFNANPLMKFDGYYLFADFVEIPNLYGEGQRFIKYLFKRFMLGVNTKLPVRSAKTQWIIGTYGVMALIWRILVVATLLFIASTLFHGAGLAIAIVSGAVVLLVPAWRFVRFLFVAEGIERPSLPRFALTLTLLLLSAWALLTQLQWSRELSAPALVAYAEQHAVRAEGGGFVDAVHVTLGDQVTEGQMLVELVNPEIEAEILDLELQIRQIEIRIRSHILNGRQENVVVLRNQTKDLKTQLENYYRLRKALHLRAPADGTVIAGYLDILDDRYVERGDAIVEIGVVKQKNLVALIEQADIDVFRRHHGASVNFSINGRGAVYYSGVLQRIEPRATRRIMHESLTALAGGPIGITQMARPGGGTVPGYTSPRFEAQIGLSPYSPIDIHEGEIGAVYVSSPRRSLGWHWYRLVSGWVDSVLTGARGSSA